MTDPAPPPNMACHLRHLLEAVKGAACGLEGRWRWFGAPMLLLTWFRTRRERREAAEAMGAIQGLLEAFLGLLEDFRAGRLLAENAPQDSGGLVRAVAAPSAVDTLEGGERRGAQRARAAVDASLDAAVASEAPVERRAEGSAPLRFSASSAMGPVAAPVDICSEAWRFDAVERYTLACAGITGTKFAGATGTGIAALLARRARSPPDRIFKKSRLLMGLIASITFRIGNEVARGPGRRPGKIPRPGAAPR